MEVYRLLFKVTLVFLSLIGSVFYLKHHSDGKKNKYYPHRFTRFFYLNELCAEIHLVVQLGHFRV